MTDSDSLLLNLLLAVLGHKSLLASRVSFICMASRVKSMSFGKGVKSIVASAMAESSQVSCQYDLQVTRKSAYHIPKNNKWRHTAERIGTTGALRLEPVGGDNCPRSDLHTPNKHRNSDLRAHFQLRCSITLA